MSASSRIAAAFAACAVATSLLPGAASAAPAPVAAAAAKPTYTAVENWKLTGYRTPKRSPADPERARKFSCLATSGLPSRTRVVTVVAKAKNAGLGRALGYQHLTRTSSAKAANALLQHFTASFVNNCAQADRRALGASRVYPKKYGVFPVTADNDQQVSVSAFVFTNASLAKLKAKGRGTLVMYFALVPSPRAVSVILLAVRFPGTSIAGSPDPRVTKQFVTLARKAALSVR